MALHSDGDLGEGQTTDNSPPKKKKMNRPNVFSFPPCVCYVVTSNNNGETADCWGAGFGGFSKIKREQGKRRANITRSLIKMHTLHTIYILSTSIFSFFIFFLLFGFDNNFPPPLRFYIIDCKDVATFAAFTIVYLFYFILFYFIFCPTVICIDYIVCA